MRIVFFAVGKSHDPIYRDAITEFTTRISRHYEVEWKFVSASGRDGIGASLDEGGEILRLLKSNDFLVALDEKGKEMTTENLAKFLDIRISDSGRRLVFLIGGAYGLSPDVLKRADTVLSLSKLTLPHQLVRVIITEAIYRANSVVRGEKYHHA
jgi:23S rRNA (pseudouridine1915-N3)-methyltransferase